MAYQVKRKQLYEKELQLLDEEGAVCHTLKVSLSPDSIIEKLSNKKTALIHAIQNVKNISEGSGEEASGDSLTVLKNGVTDLFEAVFGKEDTQVLADFYQGQYIEMCQEVLPFITSVVIPEIEKITKNNKKAVLAKYNRKRSSAPKRKGV